MKNIKSTFHYIVRKHSDKYEVLTGFEHAIDAEMELEEDWKQYCSDKKKLSIVYGQTLLDMCRIYKVDTTNTKNIEEPKDCIFCGAYLGYTGFCGQCMEERYR